jgi:hypothetical protein
VRKEGLGVLIHPGTTEPRKVAIAIAVHPRVGALPDEIRSFCTRFICGHRVRPSQLKVTAAAGMRWTDGVRVGGGVRRTADR